MKNTVYGTCFISRRRGPYLFVCLDESVVDEKGKFHYPHFQKFLNFVMLRIENVLLHEPEGL